MFLMPQCSLLLQSKRKLGLVNFSGQVEKIINHCVFRMLPFISGIGGVKGLQPRCEDPAPSTFAAAAARSPFPGRGRCSTGTNWTSGHASKLALKGDEWHSMRNQGPNKSHYFHQCYWTCSYPIGLGKLLYRMWSKHRLGGEGCFSTRVLVLKKLLQMSWRLWFGSMIEEARSCLGLGVSSTKHQEVLEALGELLMWSAQRA